MRSVQRTLPHEELTAPLTTLVIDGRFHWFNWLGETPWGFPDGSRRLLNQLIQRKSRIQVLVIQWFQAHITLFSKYFASFPHGTCSLLDSRRYLALDEIYHLIGAPIPGNATLRSRTLCLAGWMLNRAFTVHRVSFQKTYTHRIAGHASKHYIAENFLLSDMSFSFFIRHY